MKRYTGNRRKRKLLLLLLSLAVIAAAVTAVALWGGGAPRTTDPVQTGTEDNVQPPEDTHTPDDGQGQTPDQTDGQEPEPDDGQEPDGYAPIALEGDREQYDALYRIGDTGFEMYTYVDAIARRYAGFVNEEAQALRGSAQVYVLPVPLSSGITLPDELLGSDLFDDQKAAEEKIGALLDETVRYVPLNDALMRHRTEYVYYRTDHHWTALGAYYAYRAFCQAKGITPHELSEYQQESFEGFLGSFYRDSGSELMAEHPDVVEAWHPVTTEAMLDFTDDNGDTIRWKIIYDATDYDADMKYNTFIAGDQPFTVIQNPDVTDGSKCAVVKESFGNAFVPYLVDHYSTVYVVDYRYWNGDSLTDFVKDNGVQDVLFINNLSAIRSSYLVGMLQEIA
ncbi:MAG: hypothetical protein IJU18_00215 [Oscillospiraceae bacterium]|nr:hypothetical protein [Oscillospiraceae bacterium]